MKVGHRTLICLAGAVWFCIGFFLLTFGLHLLHQVVKNPLLALEECKFSVFFFCIAKTSKNLNPLAVLLTSSLLIGYLKGFFVLGRAAKKQVVRISKLPSLVSLKHLYSPGYYALICIMMIFGMLIRFLPITLDTRGSIDIAIGTALICGSVQYFRWATTSYYLTKKRDFDLHASKD